MKNKATPEEIAEIRLFHLKAPKFSTGNTNEAVIVRTWTSPRKSYLGVQYWTLKNIEAGVVMHGQDGVSYFVCKLKEKEA